MKNRVLSYINLALATFGLALGISAVSPQTEVRADLLSNSHVTYDQANDVYVINRDMSVKDPLLDMQRQFAEIDPAILSTATDDVKIHGDQFRLGGEAFRELDEKAKLCDYFVSQSEPIIVPQGTKASAVPMKVAKWVADNMEYDYNCLKDRKLSHSYQNALNCFQKGTGNCATYASAFNSLVHSAPINPETNKVDYNCENPVYYKVGVVNNQRGSHIWSTISFDGTTWSFWDITYYDIDRDKVYLNNSKADFGVTDKYHADVYM